MLSTRAQRTPSWISCKLAGACKCKGGWLLLECSLLAANEAKGLGNLGPAHP